MPSVISPYETPSKIFLVRSQAPPARDSLTKLKITIMRWKIAKKFNFSEFSLFLVFILCGICGLSSDKMPIDGANAFLCLLISLKYEKNWIITKKKFNFMFLLVFLNEWMNQLAAGHVKLNKNIWFLVCVDGCVCEKKDATRQESFELF